MECQHRAWPAAGWRQRCSCSRGCSQNSSVRGCLGSCGQPHVGAVAPHPGAVSLPHFGDRTGTFPAQLWSRSPFPEGTLTALTLKSNFGQARSSSIVHKPDIYVSEILPLQNALLFMILSNKMPLRPQPSSFSFPDVFVGQSLSMESLKASACP